MLVSITGTVSVFPLTKRRPIETLMLAVTEEVKMRQYLGYLDMLFSVFIAMYTHSFPTYID